MQANDYDWWKKRFNVIARYFDAMRIDHILGFLEFGECQCLLRKVC
jgi:4-alpha-glucanotransferase